MTGALDDLPLAAAPGPLVGTGLTKRIGGRTLWAGIDLELAPGSLTALVGPSGAGKTTLLNCLGLLEPLTGGALSFAGTPIGRRNRRRLFREEFGFLFQNFGLVEQWDVVENLSVPLRAGRIPRRDRGARIAAALDAVGLPGREDDPIHVLSGGEQQRIALARVLLHEPSVVFVDEPTASLDDGNAELVLGLLRRLTASGAIVVVSTHDDRVRDAAGSLIELPAGAITR